MNGENAYEQSASQGREASREQRAGIREGLYVLSNKKSRTVLDLDCGKPDPGTRVVGYEKETSAGFGTQLWIITNDGSDGTYTLRNPRSGTYLDLAAGCRENGSRTEGWPRTLDQLSRLNQEWRIEEHGSCYFSLQCVRTGTFLEIGGGDPTNFTRVTCSEKAKDVAHQLWCLESVSRPVWEIEALFETWRPDIKSRMIQPHGNSVEYFVLASDLRRNIWSETKLLRQPRRPYLFDYNDFVVRMKDAVAVWVNDTLKADIQGFSVLIGIIYGEARTGPRAYNWCLTTDMCSLLFFDPQTGNEFGPGALDSFGFEPTFVLL